MQRDADAFISNNDRRFIQQALTEEQRIDGRRPYDSRKLDISFASGGASATACLGETCVMAVIDAKLEPPRPESSRQREGSIRFYVEFSPTASPSVETTRPNTEGQLVMQLLQKAVRNTGMVDLEALCVSAGRKVWALAVHATVLNHAGNLMDACFLAVVAALMSFRRPDATVDAATSAITVHSPSVREPLPLSLHHTPIAVTFGLFEGGDAVVVDPNLTEEAASAGTVTVIVNTHGQVCAVQQLGGIGLTLPQVMRLVRIASGKAAESATMLKAALDTYNTSQLAQRVRRQRTSTPAAPDAAFIDVPLPSNLLHASEHDSSSVPTQARMHDVNIPNGEHVWGTFSQRHTALNLENAPAARHRQHAVQQGQQTRHDGGASQAAETEQDAYSHLADPLNVRGYQPPAQQISVPVSELPAAASALEGVQLGNASSRQSAGLQADASFEAIAARIAGTKLSDGNQAGQAQPGRPRPGRGRRRAEGW